MLLLRQMLRLLIKLDLTLTVNVPKDFIALLERLYFQPLLLFHALSEHIQTLSKTTTWQTVSHALLANTVTTWDWLFQTLQTKTALPAFCVLAVQQFQILKTTSKENSVIPDTTVLKELLFRSNAQLAPTNLDMGLLTLPAKTAQRDGSAQ